jgi:type 1 fimbriae regulatory protein FimB/type 1 fimbriae regulatory protein FimE
MRANLKLVKPAPTPINGTVPPKRACNAEVRPREYLTPKEVERLIKAARARGRYGARDGLVVLMAYRHGLRAGELAGLRWDQVDFDHGLLHVRRLENGMPSVHPLCGDELWALRALRREDNASRFVFMTERGSPMSAAGFRKMLSRTGIAGPNEPNGRQAC